MTVLSLPNLSPEGIRVISEALAEAPPDAEHELAEVLRLHEGMRRWWRGLIAALSRGLEGSQARSLIGVQVALCGADAVFLQVAIANATNTARIEDVDRAKTALAEVRAIEAKARDWLHFAVQPVELPSDEELARGMAHYEGGESEDLRDTVKRLRATRS